MTPLQLEFLFTKTKKQTAYQGSSASNNQLIVCCPAYCKSNSEITVTSSNLSAHELLPEGTPFVNPLPGLITASFSTPVYCYLICSGLLKWCLPMHTLCSLARMLTLFWLFQRWMSLLQSMNPRQNRLKPQSLVLCWLQPVSALLILSRTEVALEFPSCTVSTNSNLPGFCYSFIVLLRFSLPSPGGLHAYQPHLGGRLLHCGGQQLRLPCCGGFLFHHGDH